MSHYNLHFALPHCKNLQTFKEESELKERLFPLIRHRFGLKISWIEIRERDYRFSMANDSQTHQEGKAWLHDELNESNLLVGDTKKKYRFKEEQLHRQTL